MGGWTPPLLYQKPANKTHRRYTHARTKIRVFPPFLWVSQIRLCSLRLPKGCFKGGGGLISLPCVCPIVGNRQLSRPVVLVVFICLASGPLVLSGLGHLNSHGIYFYPPVGLGMFQQICFVKKRIKYTIFQSTHFTRKHPRELLRLKLEIVNIMKFILVIGLLRGYKCL